MTSYKNTKVCDTQIDEKSIIHKGLIEELRAGPLTSLSPDVTVSKCNYNKSYNVIIPERDQWKDGLFNKTVLIHRRAVQRQSMQSIPVCMDLN